MRVKIGQPLAQHLFGSSLSQGSEVHGYGAAGDEVWREVNGALPRSNGVRIVDLSSAAVEVVSEYAEMLELAARDNVGEDRSALGEIRSAQAWFRQLEGN